jgi:type I restriction enzyme S subunit
MSILPRYENYKDSGIEYLREIPSHWNVRRLANLGRFSKGGGIARADLTESGQPAILYGDIYTKYEISVKKIANFVSNETAKNSKVISKNTLLFTGSGETVEDIGKCVVYLCNENALAGGDIITFEQEDNSSLFLSYALNTNDIKNEKAKFSKGEMIVHIYASKLKDLYVPVPPAIEQTQIANFLESKTTLIDKAIAQKEKLIALLQERRQILIHNAVMRGLNPDNPMSDSGIEWIGKSPRHWEITRVKNVFRLIIEPAPINNDFELLSVYTDIGVKPRRELEERGNKASTTDGYWLVKKGDIIVNKLLAWMGAIGVSKYDGVTSPAYDILRAKTKIESDYFHYLFRTARCVSELRKHSRGIMDMRLRLYFDKFGDVMIPLPPLSEQKEIVSYIEAITQKTETAIACKQREIEKLKEFKPTLINSAVTGKIKVV